MKSLNGVKIRGMILRYFLLALGTVIFTLPMIYMISTSLRPKGHYNKDRKVVKIQNRRLHT